MAVKKAKMDKEAVGGPMKEGINVPAAVMVLNSLWYVHIYHTYLL